MKISLEDSVVIPVRNDRGLEEAITIAPLTIRQLYTFIEHITTGQTPALVTLCTGRSLEWIDSLDLDSYGALAQECIKLNFSRATKIAEKDPFVATKMAPLIAALGEAFALTVKSAGLPRTSGPSGAESSPTPPSSASAVATPIPAST